MLRPAPTRRLIVAAAGALALAGCTETISDFNPSAPPRARAPGVPVALVSLEGGPDAVVSRLSVAIAAQAQRRDILIVGIDGQPRYQVRGYVSAHLEGPEGELSWAFDIYDAQLRRARRVSGAEKIRGGGDPWTAVNDATLKAVAFRSLDDIAEFLASAPPPAVAAPAAGAAGRRAAGLLAGN
jgi:hypothetical protein